MEKRPLVSVVMPAYNAENYINSAIESILKQTYENIELIIVEDCSSDKTLIEIEKFKDKRISIFRNNINVGIAQSTNRAIEESKGKYIALMDDDDEAIEQRIELQVKYMEEHSNVDILGGRSIEINEKGIITNWGNTPRKNPMLIKAILLFNCMDFRNSTAMIRKDFIQKNALKYKDNCLGMQDYKFYIESSKVGTITTIDEYLLKYRKHENNETTRRMKNDTILRSNLYAQFQRESLRASGFCLEEKHLYIINKALAEVNGHCDSLDELFLLYKAFCEILNQGKKMQIDFYNELEYLCKKKIGLMLLKLDIF